MPLRVLSFVTALCFAWSFVLCSAVSAALDRQSARLGYSRSLSMKEMSRIIGASAVSGVGDGGGSGGSGGSGTTYTNPAATPGPAYPWEGSAGGVKLGNGNKLTSVGIVGWTQRGGLPVNLTLNHNSESSRNGELGPKWIMSYDDTLSVDGSGNVTVYWGDGRVYTFMKNVNGTYTPPPGIYDTLVYSPATSQGSLMKAAFYYLTTKNQVCFTFGFSQSLIHIVSIGDENANYINIGYASGTNLVKTITDATGRAITLAYDGNNRLVSATDPKGRVWGFAYTGGELWYIVEPSVSFSYNYRAFAYNSANDITTIQDRNNNHSQLGYNADNSLAWEQDNLGNQTTFTYGSNYTVVTDPNTHSTTYTIGTSGQVTAVTDVLNDTASFAYDANFNVIQKQDQRGYVWYNTYDGMGNVLTAKDPYSHTTTMTYNAHNKLLTEQLPLGRSLAVTYDAQDTPTQVQQKDASGNVLATTTLTIGANGLVSDKYDANNHHTAYAYDTNGYLNSITTPLGSKTQWAYDALGVQTSRTDAMGRTTSYTLDAWERVTTVTWPDNTTRAYGYDPNGNLTSFNNAVVSIARTYDADNRLLTESEGGTRVLAKTYDASGQKGLLSSTTDYLSTVHSFAYTARNQLSQASLPGQTASYTYDADGNQLSAINPNGTQNKEAYDNADRLTSVANYNSSGGVLFIGSYAYNADGQKTSGSESDGTALSWGYDALGHLTSEVRSGGNAPESISYGYDAAGNRTSQGGSILNGTFSYNADDELTAFTYNNTSYASATFGYDANGERTSETTGQTASGGGYGTQYGYDFEGNLTLIAASGSPNVYFGYDSLDRQMGWNNSQGARLDYQLDGNAPLTETNSTTSRVNLYGNGLVSSGGETLLPDGLGCTRGTTNGSDGVVWASGYTAFGQAVGQSGSTSSHYGWGAGSGYRSDGFGPTYASPLMKVGARYYDPEFGCFLTRDTDLSQSPYAYCNGDPVNLSDPTGHEAGIPPTFETTGTTGIYGEIGYGLDSESGDPGGSDEGSEGASPANPSQPPPAQPVVIPLGNGDTVTIGPGSAVTAGNPLDGLTFGLGPDNNIKSVGEYLNLPLGGDFFLDLGVKANTGTGQASGTATLKKTWSF